MLIRLMPEQVAKYWDYIKFAVKEAAPNSYIDAERMSNILEALLIGTMQCWMLVRVIPDDYEVLCCVVTKLNIDPATGVKNMTVFALYGYDVMDKESWASAHETIVKFAIVSGCRYIDAYTDVPQIVEMSKPFGWKNRQYIYLELPND